MNLNCSDFVEALDDFLDDRLDAGRREALLAHSLSCRACSARMALESLLRLRLKNLPLTPAPVGYADRVLLNARAATRPRRERSRRAAAMSWINLGALAASLALVTLSVLHQTTREVEGPVTAAVVAPKPKVITQLAAAPKPETIRVVKIEHGGVEPVKLVFRSPSALNGVTMELRLPAGVELAGYPGRSRLSWKTDLVAGQNVLELPVQVTGVGGVVTASINLGGDRRSFSVLVQGASRSQMAPVEQET